MSTSSIYGSGVFAEMDAGSARSAEQVVPFVLDLLEVKSVVDVGCGVGSWLHRFEQCNVSDYLGIDGDYVNPQQLKIPPDRFFAADLAHPTRFDRRFDLALCLEIGEHLPVDSAEILIDSLVALSDAVLFSAAI